MYRYYVVPDATQFQSHAEVYRNLKLFWDPLAESDAYAIINPKTKFELNKSGSLEFTILPANIHYGDFHKRKTVVVVYDDDEWIYEGIVSDAPVDFFKQRKVTCVDPLSYFCDSVQAPDQKNKVEVPKSSTDVHYLHVTDVMLIAANPSSLGWYEQKISTTDDGEEVYYELTSDTAVNADKDYYYAALGDGKNHSGRTVTTLAATKETLTNHITRLLNVHNIQVNPFKQIHVGRMYSTVDEEQHDFKKSNYRTTWDALKSDILDDYGRYFTISLGNDNELYLNYLDVGQLPSSAVPLIEYTNNMLEMNEAENNTDSLFTVLVPIGKDNVTVAKVIGHDNPDQSKPDAEVNPYIATFGGERRYVVVSPKAIDRYGYIFKPQSFSDLANATKLYERAVKYIENNYDFHVEYEVKAIDPKFINKAGHRIKVGDKVRIRSRWHSIDIDTLYVISAEQDPVNPENDSYKIGIPTSDREANNRTLTGQSKNLKSKSKSDSSGYSSGASNVQSILDNYIKPGIEWGLEIHSSLFNEVENEATGNKTRFEQNEKHIDMMAQKTFGANDQDGGFLLIPIAERGDKIPKDEGWYELKNGKFALTNDPEQLPNKDYYRRRLWTRVSEIEVGEGGIKARVDGNYLRSTACSSWIDANEDAILAITGHIHVDPETGEVIIDAGAGFRTGHTETATGPRYVQVPRSEYKDANGNLVNPHGKEWYIRKLDNTGQWTGEYELTDDTVADLGTYYYYYTESTETFVAEWGIFDENNLTGGVLSRAINNPQFKKISEAAKKLARREGLSPEGQGWYVYDETRGMFGLSKEAEVNMSTDYYTVDEHMSEVYTNIRGDHVVVGHSTARYAQVPREEYPGSNPKQSGWFRKVGDTYVQATEEEPDNSVDYFRRLQTDYSDTTSNIRKKIDNYIFEHDLDGTITEIASDVVVFNAIFTKFLHFEVANGDDITVTGADFNSVLITEELEVHSATDDARIVADLISADTINGQYMQTPGLNLDGVLFGSLPSSEDDDDDDDDDESSSGNDPAKIVIGFGAITTSGDTVNIPYTTAGSVKFDDEEEASTSHTLSFDKPASLGTVTWSSGGRVSVETAGGKKFFEASIMIPSVYSKDEDDVWGTQILEYSRTGYDVFRVTNRPAIKAHMYVAGHWTGLEKDPEENDPEITEWSKDFYVDATDAYNDGWYQASLQMSWPDAMQALGERTEMTIGFPSATADTPDSTKLTLLDADTKGSSGYVRVYRDYVDNDHRGSMIGAIQVGDWYTKGISDAKGKFGLVGPSTAVPEGEDEARAMAAASALSGYGAAYMVYKTYDGVMIGSKTFFKTPSKGLFRTFTQWDADGNGTQDDIVDGSTINIGFGGQVTVYGQRKMDGDDAYESAAGITIISPAQPPTPTVTAQGATQAVLNNVTYNDGDTIDFGSSGGEVKVYGRFKTSVDSEYTNCSGITVKASAGSGGSPSVQKSDIDLAAVSAVRDQPSDGDQKLTTMKNVLITAIQNGWWIKFTVSVKNTSASKIYYMDLRDAKNLING